MPEPHYIPTGNPRKGFGPSRDMREEFVAIEAGIDVLNSHPLYVREPGVGNETSRVYFTVPFDCLIVSATIVIEGSIVTFTPLLTVLRESDSRAIRWRTGFASITSTSIQFNPPQDAGATLFAEGVTDNDFSAGETISLLTFYQTTPLLPVGVTFALQRTA